MAIKLKENSIRRYLLGQLSEDQQQEIERRLLIEDDLFEELEATEAELVDDYVADRLLADEREQFDQHFLTTPQRQQDLQFARVFSRYVGAHAVQKSEGPERSWWLYGGNFGAGLRVAAGVAAIAIIALALWYAIPRPSSPEGPVTVMLAMSSPNRADNAVVPKIPLPSSGLKTVLELPDGPTPGTNYRARLITEDGTSRMIEIAEREGETLSIVIPTAQLKRGPYAIQLLRMSPDGTEQPVIGTYRFDIE